MDRAFELPIHITYRPPAWLAITLIISHVGAIICIFVLPVPPWIKVSLTAVVMAGLLRSLSRHLHDSYRSDPSQLILNASDEWILVDERGDRSIMLLPGAFVHPALLVLRFRDNGRINTCILAPSTVNGDILRRLRVRLRFNKVMDEKKATG